MNVNQVESLSRLCEFALVLSKVLNLNLNTHSPPSRGLNNPPDCVFLNATQPLVLAATMGSVQLLQVREIQAKAQSN